MELVSAPAPITTSISVPGGTPVECTGPLGETVVLDATTNLPMGVGITSIDWTIDGVVAGSTASISPTLSIGNHTVRVDVVADNGVPVSDTVNVVIQDTVPPVVNPLVIDVFTGNPLTVLPKITNTTQSFFNVADVCDANPSIQAYMGKIMTNGDYTTIGRINTQLNLFTTVVDLTVIATDASDNTTTGSVTLTAP